MHVDGMREVGNAVDELGRRVVAHHSGQRRIGIEQRAAGSGHINPVDGVFEQLAVTFLGQALFAQCANRSLPRRVGIGQRAAKHFSGARNIADLVVHVSGRYGGMFLAASQRADRGGDGRKRTHGLAHHEHRGE